MKILIAGVCGFVGSTLAGAWKEAGARHEIMGVDSLVRPGSETSRHDLKHRGVRVWHSDLRCQSDFETWPAVDAVIEAAANPSVLAGVDGRTSSLQLVEHNLVGTINTLEYCRRTGAAFVLLSTSRVYSIRALTSLSLRVNAAAFEPDPAAPHPSGMSVAGVSEAFSTEPPVSLYGATKRAAEQLALEYGAAFHFPVWINRCGVLAGAGQFGRPDQGIFSYWIHSWLYNQPLRYIGFDGQGHQVRDCLHPADLRPLIDKQLEAAASEDRLRLLNVAGGRESALSLRQLSEWCREHLGERPVSISPEARPFDVPWLVLDSTQARRTWDWAPERRTPAILDEILAHARAHPEWLRMSES